MHSSLATRCSPLHAESTLRSRRCWQAAKPRLESLQNALQYDQQTMLYKQHVYRLYFTGVNTTTKPWRLPLMGETLRRLLVEKHYLALADEINHAAHWRQWETLIHSFLFVLMPPLSVTFADSRRRAHYDSVAKVQTPCHQSEL